jgi:hypothetical protein
MTTAFVQKVEKAHVSVSDQIKMAAMAWDARHYMLACGGVGLCRETKVKTGVVRNCITSLLNQSYLTLLLSTAKVA